MQYLYPFSGNITTTGTVTRTKPIGKLYECANDPFVPCCICFPENGQLMYFIAGDIFQYHLNITPDSVTVYNFDGTVIGDFNNWISPNLVTVNVADLDPSIDCFYFSVMQKEVRKCFDFGFKRHNTKELDDCYGGDCGIGTITIHSSYAKVDCLGNDYEGGRYSNVRRFLAEVEFIGSVEDATLVDDVRISSKVYNQYQVRILQPLKQDSMLLSEFVEVIMRGAKPTLTIHNEFPTDIIECVDYIDGLSRSYDSERDWYPVFTVRSLECDSNLNCD